MEINALKMIKLLKNRNNEIPEALAAVSSKCSPKFPIDIILLSNIASGNAIGMVVSAVK